MALRFIDSVDHYTTVSQKWTVSGGGWLIGGGRTGGALLADELGNDQLTKVLDAQPTWIVGIAFYTGALPFTGPLPLIGVWDGGSRQCDLRLSTTGILSVTRNGTTLDTGSITLSVSTWYFLEFMVTIDNSAGVIGCRVNGVEDCLATSQDTRDAGTTADRVVLLGSPGSSVFTTVLIDDIYVCDGTGSAPTNTYLGDVSVECIFPSGNGNSSQWVGQDANSTDNYLNVDEAAPDSDTTYNESDVVGNKDTYAYGNLASATGTVYGVQPLPFAKKTAAGARSIVSVARVSATEVDSSAKVLGTSYVYLPDIRETKPGGGAWTITDVNAAEFGVKVSA